MSLLVHTKLIVSVLLACSIIGIRQTQAFSLSSPSDGDLVPSFFSLEEYQKASALQVSQSLDASRLHFQILFVDDDNVKGRIAEGKYNDAMFVLFPASATISGSSNAPRDAAASPTVLNVCNSLGLCPTTSERMGTDFDMAYLDEYDLVIAMDDDIRSLILRSLPTSEDQEYYRPRCRVLSDFLSPQFVTHSMSHEPPQTNGANPTMTTDREASTTNNNKYHVQWNMLDTDYQERVDPWLDQVLDRSSTLFSAYHGIRLLANPTTSTKQALNPCQSADWPLMEAGLIVASGGITKFCLSTIEAQFEVAFQDLLEKNIYKKEHSKLDWETVDDQLRLCNSVITGYFSPGQRKERFERHLDRLVNEWNKEENERESRS